MAWITPLFIFALPFLLISTLNSRWALLVFIASVPWKTAILFTAIGHPFNFPEVALLVLIAHVIWQLVMDDSTLRLHQSDLWLLGFAGATALSILFLLVTPPSGLYGRPYNIQQGYGAFTLVEIGFTRNSLTQFAIRLLFVVASVVLSVAMYRERELLPVVVKIVLANAFLVGVVGVLYQASVILGVGEFATSLQLLGFNRFPVDPGALGPVPRMYSITGEPGATAHFLLFALVLTTVSSLSEQRGILTDATARVSSIVLLVLIGLTTGTTGYGGLVVFTVVLIVTATVADSLRLKPVVTVVSTTVFVVTLGLLIATLTTGIDTIQIVGTQLEKLQFSAQSGSLRARYISHSLSLWAHRPIVGTGVGTQNGTSFLASTLAETGLLGGLALVGAIITSYRSGIISRVGIDDSTGLATAVAVATIGGVALVARSMSASLFPWLWLALALPNAYHFYEKRSI